MKIYFYFGLQSVYHHAYFGNYLVKLRGVFLVSNKGGGHFGGWADLTYSMGWVLCIFFVCAIFGVAFQCFFLYYIQALLYAN